jgi:hypothetical protein
MLRVPLSGADYINIGHEFESHIEPMILARFAGVLRTVLEPKLPLLRGEPAPRPDSEGLDVFSAPPLRLCVSAVNEPALTRPL